MMMAVEKKTKLLLSCLIPLFAVNSYCELLAYDGFSYTVGQSVIGQEGGTGFAGSWSLGEGVSPANMNRFIAAKDQPSYTDKRGRSLQTQPGIMHAEVAGSGAAPMSRELKNELKGTFWVSFLTKMDEQVGYGWEIALLDSQNEKQAQFFNGRKEKNRWRIQSFKVNTAKPANGVLDSTKGLLPTEQTLVILRVVNAGSGKANGSVTLYINPTELGDAEISAQGAVKISGLQLNAIKKISFDKKTTATGYLDELRIGEKLEDVVPTQ